MANVIINADDFGTDYARSMGIILGVLFGCVTSVSVLVTNDQETFLDKILIRLLNKFAGRISIGLHIDLTSKQLTLYSADDLLRNKPVYNDKRDFWIAAVYKTLDIERIVQEIESQISHFKQKFSAYPAHIDGHNHVHVAWVDIYISLRKICTNMGLSAPIRIPKEVPIGGGLEILKLETWRANNPSFQELIIKMRTSSSADFLTYESACAAIEKISISPTLFVGTTYGHVQTFRYLFSLLKGIEGSDDQFELMVHPGLNIFTSRNNWFSNMQRSGELARLITVVSFFRLRRAIRRTGNVFIKHLSAC